MRCSASPLKPSISPSETRSITCAICLERSVSRLSVGTWVLPPPPLPLPPAPSIWCVVSVKWRSPRSTAKRQSPVSRPAARRTAPARSDLREGVDRPVKGVGGLVFGPVFDIQRRRAKQQLRDAGQGQRGADRLHPANQPGGHRQRIPEGKPD